MERAAFNREQANHVGQPGSSPSRSSEALDADRAASMADEGGVAGAVTDALEQAGISAVSLEPVRRTLPSWLPWAVAGAGLAGFVFAWLRRR